MFVLSAHVPRELSAVEGLFVLLCVAGFFLALFDLFVVFFGGVVALFEIADLLLGALRIARSRGGILIDIPVFSGNAVFTGIGDLLLLFAGLSGLGLFCDFC